MINECDLETKRLIDGLTPKWRELRVERQGYAMAGETRFQTQTALFVGDGASLLCAMTAWDFRDLRWEYFPIVFRIVDADQYDPQEWITLASKGGASELDRRLQWLFETPALALTEGVEESWDSIKPDARHYVFSFYNGLLVSDPKGRGSLRLTAPDMPDFIVTGEFTFGPEAA